jgi:hypothetical protein
MLQGQVHPIGSLTIFGLKEEKPFPRETLSKAERGGTEASPPSSAYLSLPSPHRRPRTLINSLESEEARQCSSVDKTRIPHDRLRNVSGMLLALKVIFPTLVGPLRANV